jgi:hypothetical protein
MKAFALCGLLAGLVLVASCSGPAEPKRPHIYRGGQDYEHAVHAQR